MDLIQVLNSRYSTKKFDPSKKISKEQMEEIESLLQLSPSSTNVQPWNFVIATSQEGKNRIAKASEGFYAFNKEKVLNASAVIVFAAKNYIDEDHLQSVLSQEYTDGRYTNEEAKMNAHGARSIFVNMHKYDFKDLQHWAEKQLYLNLGNFLLGIACMGIDGVPMEGLDMKVLDEEFDLRNKGYTSTIVVAIGYHAENDFNAELPKSRLAKTNIITHV